MNYKELLKKYINFVGEVEGSYLLNQNINVGEPDFTDEEMAELEKLIKEIQKNQP